MNGNYKDIDEGVGGILIQIFGQFKFQKTKLIVNWGHSSFLLFSRWFSKDKLNSIENLLCSLKLERVRVRSFWGFWSRSKMKHSVVIRRAKISGLWIIAVMVNLFIVNRLLVVFWCTEEQVLDEWELWMSFRYSSLPGTFFGVRIGLGMMFWSLKIIFEVRIY